VVLRIALILPPLAAVVSGVGFAMAASGAYRTGLAEGDRAWFFVLVPPSYALAAAFVASLYAAWFLGPARLPSWVRRVLEASSGFLFRERSLMDPLKAATGAGGGGLAVRVLVQGTVMLGITVPVFSILVGWMFARGVYRPWEAAMVGGAALATIAWVAYLISLALPARRRR
jgi:hypothetical protein